LTFRKKSLFNETVHVQMALRLNGVIMADDSGGDDEEDNPILHHG
jgi:hypothetical protein